MSVRRMMTREVTKTTITIAKMEVQEGRPVAVELPQIVELGNIRIERAQRIVDKLYKGEAVTVLQVEPDTQTYEMPVEEFIKLATIKEPVANEETEQN